MKMGLDSLQRPEATTNFSLGSFSFTPGNDERRILFRLRLLRKMPVALREGTK